MNEYRVGCGDQRKLMLFEPVCVGFTVAVMPWAKATLLPLLTRVFCSCISCWLASNLRSLELTARLGPANNGKPRSMPPWTACMAAPSRSMARDRSLMVSAFMVNLLRGGGWVGE